MLCFSSCHFKPPLLPESLLWLVSTHMPEPALLTTATTEQLCQINSYVPQVIMYDSVMWWSVMSQSHRIDRTTDEAFVTFNFQEKIVEAPVCFCFCHNSLLSQPPSGSRGHTPPSWIHWPSCTRSLAETGTSEEKKRDKGEYSEWDDEARVDESDKCGALRVKKGKKRTREASLTASKGWRGWGSENEREGGREAGEEEWWMLWQ